MILKLSKFIEANLTAVDLSKGSNSKVTKYGPLRGDVLLGKIEDEEEIEVEGGDRVKVGIDVDLSDDDGKYDPSKSQNLKSGNSKYSKLRPVFYDVENKSKRYKLSDFVKTVDFGGGRGSSLGTVDTKVVETIQAYVLGFKQMYYLDRNLLSRDLESPKILNLISESKNSFGAGIVTPEIIASYKRYHLTFIKTANRFVSRSGVLDYNTMYNFHQVSSNSEFMVSLISAYKRCCRVSFGRVINMAKWTPSDIWAVDSLLERDFISKLEKLETITDLNTFIDDNFGDSKRKRKIVGISLKKVSSRKENIIVVINKVTERPQFRLSGVDLSSNEFTKGLEISISRESSKYPGSDKISVRSNTSGVSNINIEVLGSSSRHGKCSLTQINDILRSNGMSVVPTASEVKSKFDKDDLSIEVSRIDSNLKSLDNSKIRSGRKQSDVPYPSLISKYQSLVFAQILMTDKINGGHQCDSVINSIMYYALSIENQYFECPKYARVVEY